MCNFETPAGTSTNLSSSGINGMTTHTHKVFMYTTAAVLSCVYKMLYGDRFFN